MEIQNQARGQGETVPIPPPRHRLSKLQLDQEIIANQLPSTIHVTSVGVEGRSYTPVPSTPYKSWAKTLFYFGLASLITFIAVGLTLDYLDLWDPCVIRLPYEKHCNVDSYAGGMFYRTDYREESLCIIPGVFYSTKTTGWNTDGICGTLSDSKID